MKDIVIISNYWHFEHEKTSSRYLHIANLFSKHGYDTELITSTFYHREKKQRSRERAIYDDYQYKTTLIHEKGYSKNISLRRLLSHKQFVNNVLKYLKSRNVPDVIYCFVPTLELGSKVIKYAKENGVKVIVDVLDLWPESFEMILNVPKINKVLFIPYTLKANYIYKNADKIIGVSKTSIERAVKYNNKSGEIVYIGIDLPLFDRIAARYKNMQTSNEVLKIVYIGTLGHSYDIKLIIDALQRLHEKGHRNLEFIVLGDGPLKLDIIDYSAHKDVDIKFMGMLEYEKMIQILMNCDIAVNPIKKGTAASIINKHADYAAAGLPVINTQDSKEYKNLLKQYKSGLSSRPSEITGLVENLEILIKDTNLRKNMGLNNRRLAEEKFDRNITYNKILSVLDSLL